MRKERILVVLSFLFVLFLTGTLPAQPTLKVGAIIPFSAKWADSARECARGLLDAARVQNLKGGIHGRRVEIILVSDVSRTAETIAAFRKMNEADNIPLLYIHSMETALSLANHIQHNRIPTLVSMLPAHLANPPKYPYLFSILPAPLDQTKIAVLFAAERWGTRAQKPRLAFIGSPDYVDQHFLDEAKIYARTMGFDISLDLLFPTASRFSEHEADSRKPSPMISLLSPMQEYGAHFAYLSLTPREASVLIRDGRKTGSTISWICNSRTFDETLLPLEGVFGVQPIAPFGEDLPGMVEPKEAHQRWHPFDTHTVSYIEGWATFRLISDVFTKLPSDQYNSRERTKTVLESLRNHILGGLIPPVTFTPEDHRGIVESVIFVTKAGKLRRMTDYLSAGRGKRN